MPISRCISVSLSALMIAPLLTLALQAATYQAGMPTHNSSQATIVGPFHRANGVPAFIASVRSSCLDVSSKLKNFPCNCYIFLKLIHKFFNQTVTVPFLFSAVEVTFVTECSSHRSSCNVAVVRIRSTHSAHTGNVTGHRNVLAFDL